MWLGNHFQGQISRSPGRFAHRHVGASGGCSGGHGNVLVVRKLLLRCRLLGGAKRFGTHGGGEGRGHTVAAARLQLYVSNVKWFLVYFNALFSLIVILFVQVNWRNNNSHVCRACSSACVTLCWTQVAVASRLYANEVGLRESLFETINLTQPSNQNDLHMDLQAIWSSYWNR